MSRRQGGTPASRRRHRSPKSRPDVSARAEKPLAGEFFDDPSSNRHRDGRTGKGAGHETGIRLEVFAIKCRAALKDLAYRNDVNIIGEVQPRGREQFTRASEGLNFVHPDDNSRAVALIE